MLISGLYYYGLSNCILTFLVWYFIGFNLFSYFYNRKWSDESMLASSFSPDGIRSRFINLFISIAFTIFPFAYLMQIVYPNDFVWNGDIFKNTLFKCCAICFNKPDSVAPYL